MAFEPKIAIDGSAPQSMMSASQLEGKMTAADYQDQPKAGKTWKICKAKHVDYAKCALDALKANYLYTGGFRMNEPEVAKLFCPKLKSEEDDTVYKERVASAAYVPTFSKLIVGLVSNLYSQDLAVMEAADHDDDSTAGEELSDDLRDFYKLFQADCDGNGTSFHNFMRDLTTEALVHSYYYFGVDYPKGEATNRLEQELLGLDKPRLYKIHIDAVFDWKMKDEKSHELEWIKLVNDVPVQASPFDPPMHKYEIKSWFMNEEGLACYECYESDPMPLGKEPKDKDLIRKVDEGVTSFKSIPIFCFHLDDGVAVGAKLAPLAAELFNRTTIENHSTNKACLTIPVVYRGELMAGDGIPDPTSMDMRRGQHPRGKVNSRGVVELGEYNKDKFEIVEAEGKALSFIHKQNEDLDEKMHSVVHQMGQSLKQARSQSGKTAASKQEDRHATEMLLTTLADEVFSISRCVFEVIAESRGEDISWDVRGLSATAQEDREELVKEVALLPAIQIPSSTFKKEYYYRLSNRLVEGTDQRTLQTIRKEIEAGLDHMAMQPTVDANGQPVEGAQAASDAERAVWKAQQGIPQKPLAPAGQPAAPAINSPGGSDNKPNPGKTNPTKSNVASNPGNTEEDGPMALGPGGQPLLPDGAHLQTGEHVDAQVVHDQLAEDYKDKDIQFVLHIPWIGPVEVPLSSIDFSNKDNWQAAQPEDQDHVDMFADKMANDNYTKPVILVNMPHNDEKMKIVDGHHRALGALQNGQPVMAYIGLIGTKHGPWDVLHDNQKGGGSAQASQQSNQMENQASKQVAKSETAKNGKTK